MRELTHLSLFTGIGGLDLAAERAGFRTVGQCEWADYPHALLQKHWPDVPKWRDIRTLTKEEFRERTGLDTVTVLSGGFPCQPFSTAGKRRGKEDDRYLWPEMLRVISEIRPAWVFGENVAGLVSMELDTVLSDLENLGYACQALIIPACAVDAPHRRDRCVILGFDTHRQYEKAVSEICRRKDPDACGICEDVADTDSVGLQKSWMQGFPGKSAMPIANHGRWEAEPGVGRMVDGFSRWLDEPMIPRVTTDGKNRADRLRCLGNAVVPQWAYPIFCGIAEIERSLHES